MSGVYNHHWSLLLFLLLLVSPLPYLTQAGTPWQTTQIDQLPFSQEISIPFDTGNPHAHYLPIDVQISFDTPAWAQNETNHAVRVAYEHDGNLNELESQIYSLQYTDDDHITTCNLVFLIPPDADGTEIYHILYDTNQVDPPHYPSYLTVEDTHYFYEPISGQKIDFDYYKILQENYVVYGIIQKGELLGEGVSHTVVKLKPNSTEFETLNTDQFGNYAMTYNIDGPLQYTGSARATIVQKSILVQGNLMIRVQIKSTSPENTVATDGIYTYYYCPTAHKRLDCNIHHDILKTIDLGGSQQRDAYLGMSTFKARSATIENMNVGEILPTMHVYTESGITAEYSIPPDPDSEVQEWLLGTTDDIDLGEESWVCLDDPSTGKAHGMIVESSANLVKDEHDGLQIKASVKQVVKLPGLEADTGSLYLTRNSYEEGTHSTTILQGLNFTANCEFFTTETGGYETVATEAAFYQKLIAIKPISRGNVTTKPEEDTIRYTLTTTVHLEPSFPLGAALSAVVGKRFSYIYAELYKEGSLSSSGSLARLPLSEGLALDFDNTSFREKIQLIFGLFDWRNLSFFKRIRFPNLEPGQYLIKIYKENSRRKTQGQYIGFGIVNIQQDTTTRILARPEGQITLSVKDAANMGIANAQCLLTYNNIIIADSITDENGHTTIKAPCYNRKPYSLQIYYQGFQLKQTTLTLKARNQFITIAETASTPLHILDISVQDTWNLPIAVDVNPILTSTEMMIETKITATEHLLGSYQFYQLVPATYLLSLSYKSFKTETIIDLTTDSAETIRFPAEYTITLDLYNSYGLPLSEGQLQLHRENKEQLNDINRENITFTVPPADYTMTIQKDTKNIAQQPIEVRADKTLSIISTEESLIHTVITILGILLLVSAGIIMVLKRTIKSFIPLALIALLIISLVMPWWSLSGETGQTITHTNTLLYPPKIVTLTSTTNIKGGEIAAVPEELTTVLTLLSILLLLSITLFTVYLLIPEHRIRLHTIFSFLTLILLLLIILLFYIAMAQITEIGVGSILGSGPINVTIPGGTGTETMQCSWGLSLGFYLITLVLITQLIIFIKENASRIFHSITFKSRKK